MDLVEHIESFVMNEGFLSVLFAALFCYILSYLQLILFSDRQQYTITLF